VHYRRNTWSPHLQRIISPWNHLLRIYPNRTELSFNCLRFKKKTVYVLSSGSVMIFSYRPLSPFTLNLFLRAFHHRHFLPFFKIFYLMTSKLTSCEALQLSFIPLTLQFFFRSPLI
jgi:hypothetical protein